MDTRDPVNVGLSGPFVSAASQKLQVTGSIATTGGMKTVVPTGATGVLLNVTAVGPTAKGYVSVRPGDATGTPATSSLNVEAGANVPNAVQVALPTAGANTGKIDVTFDAYGTAGPTTDILIDVVGYTVKSGLQALVADVAAKANSADVYTRAQSNALYPQGYQAVSSSARMTNWLSGSLDSVSVSCPTGRTPVGGGGSNDGSGLAIDGTYPIPLESSYPTGWRVYYRNVTGSTISTITIRAHAICMAIPGVIGATGVPEGSEDGKG